MSMSNLMKGTGHVRMSTLRDMAQQQFDHALVPLPGGDLQGAILEGGGERQYRARASYFSTLDREEQRRGARLGDVRFTLQQRPKDALSLGAVLGRFPSAGRRRVR